MPDPISLRWAHPAVILVATDLSDLDRLMPFTLQQGIETGARMVLIHVLSSNAALSADVAGMPYYDTVGVLENADKSLLPWCEFARRKGVACDALVREGNAAWQIAAAARQFRADGIRSRNTEPEQAQQVASWFCGRTSAALGQPPGHNRGSRGSSPGGLRR